VKYWHDPEMRRIFFVEIAKENGKDPLVPETWYSFTRASLLQQKVSGSPSSSPLLSFLFS
jgi:hypothetical protein